MKSLMEKVYKKMVFKIILAKGIEKITPFQTCLILNFNLQISIYKNGNTFVKTVSTFSSQVLIFNVY